MHRWLLILLVAVGTFGISACSGDGNGNPPSGTGGTAGNPLKCSDFATPPPGCDETCPSGSDSECELGTFCFNGVCSAQCTAEQGCGEGSTCNGRGRCVPDTGTGGTGGTGNTGGSGCQSVEVTPTRSIPNVMFLVDQSGSMTQDFGGQNRWEAAHGAITGIVDSLEEIVRFGLTTYTSDEGNANPPCPRLPTQIDFALNNFGTTGSGKIGDPMEYAPTYPSLDGDETPTGESLDALVSIIQSDPPPADGPTIIVLATDGRPDTCAVPNPQNGQPESVAAATAAHAAGIDVFILSVGDQVGEPHLQDMANVGIGLAENGSQGNAPFWVGNNPQELEDAFNEIIGASISCEVEIDKPFDDVEKACNEGDVRLNGIPLSCPTDWRVKPGVDNVIELVGSACDTFKSGAATFTAVFPCGAIVVD